MYTENIHRRKNYYCEIKFEIACEIKKFTEASSFDERFIVTDIMFRRETSLTLN